MEESFTEYQKLFLDRFLPTKKDGEFGLMFALGIGPKEFGFEAEMLEYLKSHPTATLQELERYAKPFFPEIVIEDD